MRGDETEPNWDHPQKNILWVFKLPPRRLFKAAALCGDPLGRVWHLKKCDASVCVCVCVRAHVCMQRRERWVKELSFLHMLVSASAFKD